MRWFLLLLVVLGMGDYTPTSDGFPSDEDIPATFTANKVVGDVYPQGADAPYQRLVNTRGGGFLTTNSDPSVVGVDPLTGETAPVGTDVGFAAPLRRFIQTGVLNGDFSQGPPDPDMPISDDNPLPYWTWTPDSDGRVSLSITADAAAASGYKAEFTFSAPQASTSAGQKLYQLIPVPMSQGQQYRVLVSAWVSSSASATMQMFYQFYRADGVTAIGSEVAAGGGTGAQEQKFDAGLVPPTASYLRLRISPVSSAAGTIALNEVRAAFTPAEATVGIASKSASTGAISTTETTILSALIPANTLVAGSQYVIKALGTMSDSGGVGRVATYRLRVGTSLLSGSIVESMNPTTTGTASADGYMLEATLTVSSVGATGTVYGTIEMNGGSQPFAVGSRVDVSPSTTTIDTTVANYIELTARTANASATTTFRQAYIQCVMAS